MLSSLFSGVVASVFNCVNIALPAYNLSTQIRNTRSLQQALFRIAVRRVLRNNIVIGMACEKSFLVL
jgi:hypothetical protein